jgi:hypothetical protein
VTRAGHAAQVHRLPLDGEENREKSGREVDGLIMSLAKAGHSKIEMGE